jgi:hypothetical protein
MVPENCSARGASRFSLFARRHIEGRHLAPLAPVEQRAVPALQSLLRYEYQKPNGSDDGWPALELGNVGLLRSRDDRTNYLCSHRRSYSML